MLRGSSAFGLRHTRVKESLSPAKYLNKAQEECDAQMVVVMKGAGNGRSSKAEFMVIW